MSLICSFDEKATAVLVCDEGQSWESLLKKQTKLEPTINRKCSCKTRTKSKE